MHTSLAYLSPELRTFDAILQHAFNGTLRTTPLKIVLPTEILLMIRLHLLPTVTTHLFRRSTRALARYEASLRILLCQDCLSYNQEVYGPDIWGWEHFSGACSCRGNWNKVDDCQTEYRHALEYCDLWDQKKAFPECSTWLELYLSLESSRLIYCRCSIRSIWDVVTVALKDHGCRVYEQRPPPTSSYCLLRGMKIILDIPTPIVIVPDHQTISLDSESGPIALRRANRDLGLSFAYERGLQMWKDVRPNTRFHTQSSNKPSFASHVHTQAMEIVSTMSTAVVVAVSLPITLATVALAVVCFYSPKSRALRII
ncbi:hypothetical protein H2248_001324 [Termitomyces sp. 'cryptogamus']|nr:hypothetical protein H2248_001324 [Termitomyces sp. 'cryptogamus']